MDKEIQHSYKNIINTLQNIKITHKKSKLPKLTKKNKQMVFASGSMVD